MVKNRNIVGWIAKAEVDFEAARMLARSRKKGMSDAVCYHCQQCAEKYLKAYLVSHRVVFPRTHDLKKLLEIVLTLGIRYPGETAIPQEARKAIQANGTVRKIVRERLGHT